MDISEQLLTLIKDAKLHSKPITSEETLLLLETLAYVTEEKELLGRIIKSAKLQLTLPDTFSTLSRRESQVFKLIGAGLSSRETAVVLEISEATVSTHRKKIIKKLKLSGPGKLQKVSMQYLQSK